MKPLTLETLARAVSEMRRVQKEYFHTRDLCKLAGARQREVEVDRMLREYYQGADLFEHARACAGESTPSAMREDAK